MFVDFILFLAIREDCECTSCKIAPFVVQMCSFGQIQLAGLL